MYLEYDWTYGVYRPRFADIFTDIAGWRYFETLADAKAVLSQRGFRLGRKTDSRTWQIVKL